MDRSVEFYTKVLGLKVLDTYRNTGRGKDIVFLGLDEPVLELLSATTNPEANIRPSRGCYDHLAWYVDDIEASVTALKSCGVALNPDQVMTVLDGRRVAFFQGPDGERVELVERAPIV
jgi:lactoylglutathione lyase